MSTSTDTIIALVLHGIGTSPLRKEDWPLVRGEGTFVADFKRPGMVHAFVARSPFAHARFTRITTAAALAAPGVIDVITVADLPDRAHLIPTRQFHDEGSRRFLQRPLADGVVRYSGEPVAVVIAESRYLAEDAAELLDVDYEQLPPVLDEEFRIQRHAAVPLETRGLFAEYDPGRKSVTVWGAAKIPHVNKKILAQLLGWDEE